MEAYWVEYEKVAAVVESRLWFIIHYQDGSKTKSKVAGPDQAWQDIHARVAGRGFMLRPLPTALEHAVQGRIRGRYCYLRL